MRRFTPFIVIGILLLSFFIIGLIFDTPTGSFSIWNQLTPPEKVKNTYSKVHFQLPSNGSKTNLNLSSIKPIPPPGGGKPTINLVSIKPVPPPGGGKPTLNRT